MSWRAPGFALAGSDWFLLEHTPMVDPLVGAEVARVRHALPSGFHAASATLVPLNDSATSCDAAVAVCAGRVTRRAAATAAAASAARRRIPGRERAPDAT